MSIPPSLLDELDINVKLKCCGIYPIADHPVTKKSGDNPKWVKIDELCESLGHEEARVRLGKAFKKIDEIEKRNPNSWKYRNYLTNWELSTYYRLIIDSLDADT